MERNRNITRRRNSFWLSSLMALVLLSMVSSACVTEEAAGAAWEGPPGLIQWEAATAPEISYSAELVGTGRRIYGVRCAICHGRDGEGDGPASTLLATPPRDFTEGVYKFRTTPQEGMPADQDLFRTITAGFPAHGMPSFRYLSQEARWALVHYVKSLYPNWDRFGQPQVIALSQEPPDQSGAVDRGRSLYETKFNCLECHGPEGHGDGERAPELEDQWERPISPRNFTRGPTERKAGWRRADTVRMMATGIPSTPMPSFIDQLADVEDLSEFWDVAHYVEFLTQQAQEE